MSKQEPDFVMDTVTVASFIGNNIFAKKAAVVLELKMDLKSKCWFIFVADGKKYMHDHMIELFKLHPNEAIERWREIVLSASEWGWDECYEAFIRVPFEEETSKLEINNIEWFFNPNDDDPEVVKIKNWINSTFPVKENKNEQTPS